MLVVAVPSDAGAAPAKERLPLSVSVGVVNVRASSLSVVLRMNTRPRAKCSATVSAAKLSFPLPRVLTTKRGAATLKWRVESGAPRGQWTFRVRCTKGRLSATKIKRARISLPGGDGRGVLVAPGSLATVTGTSTMQNPGGNVSGYGAGGNPFARDAKGYCTYGAWEKASWIGDGVTPLGGVRGDAKNWAYLAGKRGFATGKVPQVDAIYVSEAGDWGHVAVVTRVISSTKFEVVEMNGGATWVNQSQGVTNEFGQFRPDASHPQPRIKYTGDSIRFIYKPGTGPGNPGTGPGPGPGPGGPANLDQGMKAGTSPAIAALAGGGYQMAFQANTGELIRFGAAGNANERQGMAPGTSPAIAGLAGGGYEMAFQANTGQLIRFGTAGNANEDQGMKAGTSPSIAALPGGGYQMAFQANTGDLIVFGSAGNINTGQGMMAGTSPAIAASPQGGYQVAFQANTGNLYTYSR